MALHQVNSDSINLYLSESRAWQAATIHRRADESVTIEYGTCRWSDGSVDHGYKVVLTSPSTGVRVL